MYAVLFFPPVSDLEVAKGLLSFFSKLTKCTNCGARIEEASSNLVGGANLERSSVRNGIHCLSSQERIPMGWKSLQVRANSFGVSEAV